MEMGPRETAAWVEAINEINQERIEAMRER